MYMYFMLVNGCIDCVGNKSADPAPWFDLPLLGLEAYSGLLYCVCTVQMYCGD